MQGLTHRRCQEIILRLDVLSFPDDNYCGAIFIYSMLCLHPSFHHQHSQMLICLGIINQLLLINKIKVTWATIMNLSHLSLTLPI